MVEINSIWDNQKPDGSIIIKTRIDNIPHLNCYAAKNSITGQLIYLMQIAPNVVIPELKNYRFRGVEIFSVVLPHMCELNIHLLDNDLKDIFSLFVQNILEEITSVTTQDKAVKQTMLVISRWKRLFDKINFNGLSLEQQKGLIGELLFINQLLDNQRMASEILNAWAGPEYNDKDFLLGSLGIEVKFTSSKTPRIRISNERQLNTENLRALYLIVFVADEVRENGFTLNTLVNQTRQKISLNAEDVSLFDEKLLMLGYRDEHSGVYTKMYAIRNIYNFHIVSDFPKIDTSQLPIGLYDISYSIEISAAVDYMVTLPDIIGEI